MIENPRTGEQIEFEVRTPELLVMRSRVHREPRTDRVQRAIERVQHEPEGLERHDAEERRIARLTEDDRTRRAYAGVGEHAVRNLPYDGRAVREHELHLARRLEAEGPPHGIG